MEQTSSVERRKQIGARIRELREAQGLSIPECARLAQLHWRDFAAAEQGRSAFPTDALMHLCAHLDISPASVLSFELGSNTEVAIQLASHLFGVAIERDNVTPEEFEHVLRLALVQGQKHGEIYIEDLSQILEEVANAQIMEAGE